jgi:hypothetical protein
MLKPICVACQRFYRPHHTGRWFVEGMPKPGLDGPPESGTAHPENWQPYKVWNGDEWICHGCGHLIIVGVGHSPVRERYQPDFEQARAAAMYLQVNDC